MIFKFAKTLLDKLYTCKMQSVRFSDPELSIILREIRKARDQNSYFTSIELSLRRKSKVINTGIFLVTVERARESYKIKASDERMINTPNRHERLAWITSEYICALVRFYLVSYPTYRASESLPLSRIVLVPSAETRSCTVNCITVGAHAKGRAEAA